MPIGRREPPRVSPAVLLSAIGARRTLGRQLFGTIGTVLVIQLTLVGTGILLARALGPTDRGQLAFLMFIAALAWQLGALGIPQAVTYFVARDPQSAEAVLDLIRKPYRLQILVTTIVTAVVLAASVQHRPGYVHVGALVVLAILPTSISQQIGFAVMQGLRMFKPFNLLRMLRNSSFLVIGGVLYVAGVSEFVPLAIAWGVGMIVGAPEVHRRARSGIQAHSRARSNGLESSSVKNDSLSESSGVALKRAVPTLHTIRRFGLQSLVGATSPVETFRLDQAAVAIFLPPVSLGYYVVAIAFTNLPRFIGQAVGLVANPYVARHHEREDALRAMWLFTAIGSAALVPLIAVLWLAAPVLVTFFFGEAFAESVGVVRVLLIASIFYGIRRVLSDAARGAGYPLQGSVAEAISVVVAISLFPVLIPRLGLDGAAIALLAAAIVALAALVGGIVRAVRRGVRPDPDSEVLSSVAID